jgi:hypothetical protein
LRACAQTPLQPFRHHADHHNHNHHHHHHHRHHLQHGIWGGGVHLLTNS